jgi:hypothetical protein
MTKTQVERSLDELARAKNLFATQWGEVKEHVWTLILDGRPEEICEECKEVFPKSRKDQKFCSKECKKAWHNARR